MFFLSFFFPRKKIAFLLTMANKKLFQTLQCPVKVLRNHILFQCFVGLLMSESYCVERCGTAESGASMWPWSRDLLCSVQKEQHRK